MRAKAVDGEGARVGWDGPVKPRLKKPHSKLSVEVKDKG